MERGKTAATRRFEFVLIKPSHYDDDGYVIQWYRSAIPSNTLAVLYGLALDCAERRVLGDDVDIEITAYRRDQHARSGPTASSGTIQATGGGGMVALVGVQSNQFPRAVDIARPLRAAGMQVAIGGFHVSGAIAMLPGLPAGCAAALDLGISLFAGEAEGRLETVLLDASTAGCSRIYNLHGRPARASRRARCRCCRRAGSSAPAARPDQLRRRPRLPVPVLVLHHHQRPGAQVALSLRRRCRADRPRATWPGRLPVLHHRRQFRPQQGLGGRSSTG